MSQDFQHPLVGKLRLNLAFEITSIDIRATRAVEKSRRERKARMEEDGENVHVVGLTQSRDPNDPFVVWGP